MSAHATASNVPVPAPRWRLWIDGCGGFLLLGGTRWSVGGLSQQPPADVCVRADWPRVAGSIERKCGDYFWLSRASSSNAKEKQLLSGGCGLPVSGSAQVSFHRSSPLCESAVLRVKPPHRFNDHVDAVVLLADSILIGPTHDCHIRSPEATARIVLTSRAGSLQVKEGRGGGFRSLTSGNRQVFGSLALTLEDV